MLWGKRVFDMRCYGVAVCVLWCVVLVVHVVFGVNPYRHAKLWGDTVYMVIRKVTR